MEKEEKDASKEEQKTNDSNWSDTSPGLLLLVDLAVHGVVIHQLICIKSCKTCWKTKKTFMSTNITTAYHILVEENSNLNDTSVFSATFVVFFSMLSLPSMVSATNSHVLNVVRHVESIKKLACKPQSPQHVTSSWKNSNRSNTSYLSLTFLVSFSMLSLPPTVSSTTSSHVLNFVKHVETFMNFHVNHHHHSVSHPSWRNSNWSDTS